MENEIQALQTMVLKGQKDLQQISSEVEQLRETTKAIKMGNDERISNIQKENRDLDSNLAVKEAELNKQQSAINQGIFEARAKLLRRIVLSNLRALLPQTKDAELPDGVLSTIYKGSFATIYDEITLGKKPVNMHQYQIRLSYVSDEKRHIQDLLKALWPTYSEIHHGWGNERPLFFQRDFPSSEDATKYAERNRSKICQELIDGMVQLEKEVVQLTSSFDEVFDFRLHTDPTIDGYYSNERERFKVVSAEKHVLVLSPFLSSYDRNVQHIQPYKITVTQEGRNLTISNHRYASEARQIKHYLCRFFTTDFKAVEADTQREIGDPT